MTYKQLVDYLLGVALDNLGINSSSVGELYEINRNATIQYPHFYLESMMPREVLEGRLLYRFAFNVMDRSLEDKSNVIDIVSKCEHLAESVIMKLQLLTPEYIQEPLSYNMLQFSERFQDRVHGVRVEMVMEFPYPVSTCELPYFPVQPEQPYQPC